MRCVKCHSLNDQVLDSRLIEGGTGIRRRRECLKCAHRFTTYEEIHKDDLHVVKKDGRHEKFQRSKIFNGIEKACEKRPVSLEQIDRIVNEIIEELENEYDREIPSRAIGEKIMHRLRQEDEVAYVRYASVYRQFRDIGEFVREIQTLSQQEGETHKAV
jgi:transcriptional repressor NrdR